MSDNNKKSNYKSKITLDIGKTQKGVIKVHSQILDDLSSGIYSSTASCLKELVNNSYDADATRVTIRVLPDLDTITIVDDGEGMNGIDFDEKFAWISKSSKRETGEKSKKGRPLIGKIGIGFIAVNEICDKVEIISTKKGENFKFTAIVDFKKIIKKDKTKEVVFASRIQLIGNEIKRNYFRHFIGRVFATCVSLFLKIRIYDTQCGAKMFSRKICDDIFYDQFISPWLFDVELFARLLNVYGVEKTIQMSYEHPVSKWIDIDGSKVRVLIGLLWPGGLHG